MKTGRLLKFHRAGTDVHAYLYREGGRFQAALYLIPADRREQGPAATLSGAEEAGVGSPVRGGIQERDPPAGRRPPTRSSATRAPGRWRARRVRGPTHRA